MEAIGYAAKNDSAGDRIPNSIYNISQYYHDIHTQLKSLLQAG
jgi:hypothetical protein